MKSGKDETAGRDAGFGHLLDDGTTPGFPYECLLCGKRWRFGPRGGRCKGWAKVLPEDSPLLPETWPF